MLPVLGALHGAYTPIALRACQNSVSYQREPTFCICGTRHKRKLTHLVAQYKHCFGTKPFLTSKARTSDGAPIRTWAGKNPANLGTPQKVATGLLFGAVGATAAYLFLTKGFSLSEAANYITRTVEAYGPWGPVIFTAAFVVATLLLIPATGLTLAAGFLFGPVSGTALVTLAATLGAAAAFLVSRYLARDLIKGKLQSYPKLKAIEEQVSAEGIKIVLLLRLAPLVPFTILNYALGVTDISFGSYTVATALGKLLGVFSQVYIGSTGRSVETATTARGSSNVSLALTAVGVVASILVTKVIADKASAVLKEYDSDLDSSNEQQP